MAECTDWQQTVASKQRPHHYVLLSAMFADVLVRSRIDCVNGDEALLWGWRSSILQDMQVL